LRISPPLFSALDQRNYYSLADSRFRSRCLEVGEYLFYWKRKLVFEPDDHDLYSLKYFRRKPSPEKDY